MFYIRYLKKWKKPLFILTSMFLQLWSIDYHNIHIVYWLQNLLQGGTHMK